MDGKKKLEELVAEVNSWPEWQATRVFAADIRSISDAYKAMEAENERLRALIAAGDDAHRSIVKEAAAHPAMKDDLVNQCAKAIEAVSIMCDTYSLDREDAVAVTYAILAIARPAILEEAADIRDALSDSQYLAGVTAGWNAAQADNPNDALARIHAAYEGHLKPITERRRALAHTTGQEPAPTCPICAEPFKADDICATDINEGTCHAECLEGSPVVDLDTGEPSDGSVDTFTYGQEGGR